MPLKILYLVAKNLFRSKTRTLVSVIGCVLGAFVITFFLSAQHSLSHIVVDVSKDSNLMITQKDKY